MDGETSSLDSFDLYTDIIDASEGNDSMSTVCRRQSFTSVQILFRVYLLPIVSLFGLIANVINIRIFSHQKMRNQPVNWFFLALSVSDLAVMLTSFLVFQLPAYAEKMDNLGFYNAAQQIILTFYPLARSSHTCSVVLTVVVSVHRYLGVCHPFLIRRISNAAVIRAIIVGSVVFSFLFNGTKWFDLQITSCNSTIFLGQLEKVIEPSSSMVSSVLSWPILEMSGYTLVMFVLPFTILIFVNVKIVLTLRNSHRFRLRRQMTQRNGGKKTETNTLKTDTFKKKLFKRNLSVTCEKEEFPSNGNSSPPNGVSPSIPVASGSKKESSQNISVMLLAITCQFLSFNLLAFIHNMIELMRTEEDNESELETSFTETLLTELSTFLVNLNCASTIVIYLKFGSKYRVVFLKMLSMCPFMSSARTPSPHCTALNDTTLLISQGSSIRNKLWPSTRSQSVHRPPDRTLNDLRLPSPRQNRAMSAQITLDTSLNQFTNPIRV